MKKNFFTIVCFAATLFTACSSQQPANKFTVKGNVSGLNDGDTIQLVPRTHSNFPAYAKTVVKNGQFSFEGTIEEPRLMSLMIKDTYGAAIVMLENSDIEVVGKAVVSKAYDGTPDYDYDVKVTGSPLTDKFFNLYAVRDSLNRSRIAFEKRYKEFNAEYNKAYQDKDSKRIEELRNSEMGKSMLEEDKVFFRALEASYNKVVMDNKDSFWAPLMMIEMTSYLTPDQKPMYEALSQEAKDSFYGQQVKEELYPAGSVGQKVQPFTVKDAAGKEVTLTSMLEGKKYVLIDFWASWCAPCRKEIPNLKNIYKQYKGKGFDIISISIDKSKTEWEKALKEEGLEWHNFCDGQVADIYKVKSIPAMYLIDAQGVLVGENLRGEALAKKVEELLGAE